MTNPEGWFKTELEPRIARKQDRTLWRLTWEGGRPRGQGPAAGAGGGVPGVEKDQKPRLYLDQNFRKKKSIEHETGHPWMRREFCFVGHISLTKDAALPIVNEHTRR